MKKHKVYVLYAVHNSTGKIYGFTNWKDCDLVATRVWFPYARWNIDPKPINPQKIWNCVKDNKQILQSNLDNIYGKGTYTVEAKRLGSKDCKIYFKKDQLKLIYNIAEKNDNTNFYQNFNFSVKDR